MPSLKHLRCEAEAFDPVTFSSIHSCLPFVKSGFCEHRAAFKLLTLIRHVGLSRFGIHTEMILQTSPRTVPSYKGKRGQLNIFWCIQNLIWNYAKPHPFGRITLEGRRLLTSHGGNYEYKGFWVFMPCSLTKFYRHFGVTCCFLNMLALCYSETSLNYTRLHGVRPKKTVVFKLYWSLSWFSSILEGEVHKI
jgi:hypothetical protein